MNDNYTCCREMTNDEKYAELVALLEKQEELPNGTKELLNYYGTFSPGQQMRRAKQSYVDAELAWYKSKDRNIKGHPKIEDNPIWQGCAAPDGSVNSNYGWCVFSEENGKQYKHAVNALLEDDCTRQSVCVYIRPEIQTQHNDGIHANHDFICTFNTHHFIRHGRLEYIVYMRSNDVEFGLPYDLAWHQHVYSQMFEDIRMSGELTGNDKLKYLEVGKIHWHASSMHLYTKRQSSAGASLA